MAFTEVLYWSLKIQPLFTKQSGIALGGTLINIDLGLSCIPDVNESPWNCTTKQMHRNP